MSFLRQTKPQTNKTSDKQNLRQTKKSEDRATPQMEILISVLVGELVSRSMSSIIRKYSKSPAPAVEASLERILLRSQVIIDEAEGRHITNQGMLWQLRMLRDAMYQGYYMLDTSRCRAHQEDVAKDNHAVSHSRAVSKFGHAKRLCLASSNSRKTSQGLEEVLDGLRTMIHDASEMVMFLTTYPQLNHQPFSMHLLLDRCMFGRQMEMQLVMNFLLCRQPFNYGLDKFDVLPIVGPGVVGKSTLVAHVCEDERVRDHFSQILFFSHDNFSGEDIATLRERCAPGHENNGRLLVVVDIVGELDEDMYERLCSLCQQSTTSGSKIIVTSRSDKITKLGTTQALTLQHLSHEAYWYYFKLITFGSTDPKMHPRLAALGMEIARIHNGSLFSASITGSLLRNNLNVKFWSKVLAFLKGYLQKHFSKFGEHPSDILEEKRPMYFQRMGENTIDFLIVDQYQTCSSEEEVPTIAFIDVMYGGVKPQGPFKVLAWKSPIPPYHRFIYNCEIRELPDAVKRKRSRLSG